MRALLALVVVCSACGAEVGIGNNAGNGGDVDAPPGEPPVDAPDPVDAPPDAPACFNGRVVFLSFEGETLTRAAISDARANQASWMTIDQGTAPPYRAGDADRLQQIDAIVTTMRDQLSQFPITIVTERPASGDYVMIVFGGQPEDVGSRFGGAVQQLDCDDATTRNDVAWVSDGVDGTQKIANFAVGAIGFGLGLTATTDPNDCMCGWDNDCNSDNSQACKLNNNIARDPDARQLCPGADAKQFETQAFDHAFCE